MPLFDRQSKEDAQGFRKLKVFAREIETGKLTRVKVKGQVVLISRWQGQLQAFSNICPHAAADLGQGRFTRGLIKCPDHGYTFDIRTGRAVWPEDEVCRLKRYALKENEGAIWIKLE